MEKGRKRERKKEREKEIAGETGKGEIERGERKKRI